MLSYLPSRIRNAVNHVNFRLLYELRIRAGKPLEANFNGKYVFLGDAGICQKSEAIVPDSSQIEEILFAASGYSVYSVENQIKQGFLTGSDGERIGIAGSYVFEGSKVLSVQSVTSLCIRIPHEIRGCAEEIYARCFKQTPNSLLILAPPGEGKTTILRDLTRLVCERNHLNVLVSDERGELSAGDLGPTADCIKFCDKLTAFTAGIRAMRPDLIVTDELLPEDYPAVRRALESGIFVFASAHLKYFESVPQKVFSRYVFLDGLGKIGKICGEDGSALA